MEVHVQGYVVGAILEYYLQIQEQLKRLVKPDWENFDFNFYSSFILAFRQHERLTYIVHFKKLCIFTKQDGQAIQHFTERLRTMVMMGKILARF